MPGQPFIAMTKVIRSGGKKPLSIQKTGHFIIFMISLFRHPLSHQIHSRPFHRGLNLNSLFLSTNKCFRGQRIGSFLGCHSSWQQGQRNIAICLRNFISELILCLSSLETHANHNETKFFLHMCLSFYDNLHKEFVHYLLKILIPGIVQWLNVVCLQSSTTFFILRPCPNS